MTGLHIYAVFCCFSSSSVGGGAKYTREEIEHRTKSPQIEMWRCNSNSSQIYRLWATYLLTYLQPDTLVVGVDREIERTAYVLRGLELEGEEEEEEEEETDGGGRKEQNRTD